MTRVVLFVALLTASSAASYEKAENKHCGGTSIETWASGGSSSYGAAGSLDSCKATCGEHSDCKGFVLRESDQRCSFWKGGTLAPYDLAGHDCFTKVASTPAPKATTSAPTTTSAAPLCEMDKQHWSARSDDRIPYKYFDKEEGGVCSGTRIAEHNTEWLGTCMEKCLEVPRCTYISRKRETDIWGVAHGKCYMYQCGECPVRNGAYGFRTYRLNMEYASKVADNSFRKGVQEETIACPAGSTMEYQSSHTVGEMYFPWTKFWCSTGMPSAVKTGSAGARKLTCPAGRVLSYVRQVHSGRSCGWNEKVGWKCFDVDATWLVATCCPGPYGTVRGLTAIMALGNDLLPCCPRGTTPKCGGINKCTCYADSLYKTDAEKGTVPQQTKNPAVSIVDDFEFDLLL